MSCDWYGPVHLIDWCPLLANSVTCVNGRYEFRDDSDWRSVPYAIAHSTVQLHMEPISVLSTWDDTVHSPATTPTHTLAASYTISPVLINSLTIIGNVVTITPLILRGDATILLTPFYFHEQMMERESLHT